MMESKICGPCALKAEIPLAERINLANSRKLDTVYLCTECGKNHIWTFKRSEELSAEQPPEILRSNEIVEIQEPKEIFVQTRLF